MDQHKTALPVLARFPDLSDHTHQTEHNKTTGIGLLASSGRMIGQTLSIKLLAGTALFLLVGAVLPFCIGKNSPPADSSPAGSPTVTAQDESAITTPEPPRAVRVAVAKEPSSAPEMLSPLPETNGKLQPSPTRDASLASHLTPDNPLSSSVGGETPQPNVTPPATPRPTEYKADNRGNSTPWHDPETRR
jgi:hypothetical protein